MAFDPLYPRRPPPPNLLAFGSGGAIEDAHNAGLVIRRDDWREIFLAITDTMATDGWSVTHEHLSAAYVGPVRDGERWTIVLRRDRFDVLYNPDRAQVYRLLPPRAGMGVIPEPAPRPLAGAV